MIRAFYCWIKALLPIVAQESESTAHLVQRFLRQQWATFNQNYPLKSHVVIWYPKVDKYLKFQKDIPSHTIPFCPKAGTGGAGTAFRF